MLTSSKKNSFFITKVNNLLQKNDFSLLGCENAPAFGLQIWNIAGVYSKQFSFEQNNVLYWKQVHEIKFKNLRN